MKYLVVDASLSGTGIRDKHECGYLAPESIGISADTIEQLKIWLAKYEDQHYNGFADSKIIDGLDKKGKEIAVRIKYELSEVKLEYFSDARVTSEII